MLVARQVIYLGYKYSHNFFIFLYIDRTPSYIGNCLSLFLKQSPLIDELAIFDNNSSTYGLALDLNYIDTRCKVSTCNHPEKCLEETLQGAKIVMIVTDRISNPESNEVLKSNAIMLSDLLPNIIKFAPQVTNQSV